MTKTEAKPTIAAVNELFAKSPDGLRELVRAVMQEMLEAEMTDAVGAEKGERSAARLSYRSGSPRQPQDHVRCSSRAALPARDRASRPALPLAQQRLSGAEKCSFEKLIAELSAAPWLPRQQSRFGADMTPFRRFAGS
jgi:hypothetical protein